jgi:succinate dehydrogenase hydrophobic anchor subunit
MLSSLILAMAGLVAPPADTVTPPPAAEAASLSPALASIYPERFGPDGGKVLVVTGPAAALAPQRAKAVTHSDAYYTRVKIHRIGAITMAPLFVAQFLAGMELYNNPADPAQWAQDAHAPLAASIAVVYGVNSVLGIWNAIEDWNSPGRARRTVHGALMLLAGAGFVAVGATAPENEYGEGGGESEGNRDLHRGLAIGSMSTAIASGLMMLIWK